MYSSTKMKVSKSEAPKKRASNLRKMTEKEKALVKKHFNQTPHSKSEQMKMRNKIMRGAEIKSMKGLMKLHNSLFGEKSVKETDKEN